VGPAVTAALEELGSKADSWPKAPSRQLLVIANPYASTVSEGLKNLILAALRGRYEVEVVDTENQDHATELARKAAEQGYDAVVAFGGDGTVNEVANGLANTDTALCVLPGGTTNVYCRIIGGSRDIVEATEKLLQRADNWQPKSVDLGKANDRYFTFSAGVGLDALVVNQVDSHPKRKARYGVFYFTLTALRYVFKKPTEKLIELTLQVGDTRIDGETVIVQNGDPFTYFNSRPLRPAYGTEIDSGELSIALATSIHKRHLLSYAWKLLSKKVRFPTHKSIKTVDQVKTFTVSTRNGQPLPVQVDGDYIGTHNEVKFSVEHNCLNVVV